MEIRPGRESDLPAIQQILEQSREAAAWTLESLKQVFHQNRKYFFSASASQSPIGFICAHGILDEAEILNLAVLRPYRRQGVATALLQVLLEALSAGRATKVFLEVRESNLSAIEFYERSGFRSSGRRPRYYRDPDEAALILTLTLPVSPA